MTIAILSEAQTSQHECQNVESKRTILCDNDLRAQQPQPQASEPRNVISQLRL